MTLPAAFQASNVPVMFRTPVSLTFKTPVPPAPIVEAPKLMLLITVAVPPLSVKVPLDPALLPTNTPLTPLKVLVPPDWLNVPVPELPMVSEE